MGLTRPLCERTARLVSLSLDGELSEVEERLLERHLASCARCRAFTATAAALTEELRAEPLVPVPSPVTVPRSPRLGIRGLRAATAAATFAAITIVSVFALGSSGKAVRSPSVQSVVEQVRPDFAPVLPSSLDTYSQRRRSLELEHERPALGRVPGPQLR